MIGSPRAGSGPRDNGHDAHLVGPVGNQGSVELQRPIRFTFLYLLAVENQIETFGRHAGGKAGSRRELQFSFDRVAGSQPGYGDLGNIGPRAAERVADDQQLIGAATDW